MGPGKVLYLDETRLTELADDKLALFLLARLHDLQCLIPTLSQVLDVSLFHA